MTKLTAAKIDPADVEVRYLHESDLPMLIKYFFENDAFMATIGVKPAAQGDAELFAANMRKKLTSTNAYGQIEPTPNFTVLYKGEPIGFHTSTHFIPGESLIMHAHFTREDLRGRGIGVVSYVKALDKFLTEFMVQKVIFKTPIQNKAPMKIKEKLGLKPIADETIDWPVLIKPLPTKVFEVTREMLPALREKAQIATALECRSKTR